jgi:hypothetical protein
MDIAWIAAVAVLWALVVEMVIGLNRLVRPKQSEGERS